MNEADGRCKIDEIMRNKFEEISSNEDRKSEVMKKNKEWNEKGKMKNRAHLKKKLRIEKTFLKVKWKQYENFVKWTTEENTFIYNSKDGIVEKRKQMTPNNLWGTHAKRLSTQCPAVYST